MNVRANAVAHGQDAKGRYLLYQNQKAYYASPAEMRYALQAVGAPVKLTAQEIANGGQVTKPEQSQPQRPYVPAPGSVSEATRQRYLDAADRFDAEQRAKQQHEDTQQLIQAIKGGETPAPVAEKFVQRIESPAKKAARERWESLIDTGAPEEVESAMADYFRTIEEGGAQ